MIENIFSQTADDSTIALHIVTQAQLQAKLTQHSDFVKNQIAAADFQGKAHTSCLLVNSEGRLDQVWSGADDNIDCFTLAHLPLTLPQGNYALAESANQQLSELAIGWGLASYQFTAYKKAKRQPAKLYLPAESDYDSITRTVNAMALGRTLINRAPHDLTPEKLADAANALAQRYNAVVSQIIGDDLLEQNYPAVHAVGRASDDAPRLIDLQWGDDNHPKLTLVGKGVCFDTGGILVKPYSSMELMKKDMGGAAHVLALADMIMSAQLPIRLRVLIPAVDNAISGNAYYPSDIIVMRNGKTVEVGHTDAEGRLILADALVEAVSEKPELLIDFATLTGAARVALGTELPAMFASHQKTGEALHKIADEINDPLWPMPLYQPYKKMLDSHVADMSNIGKGGGGYGGAIIAALFLQAFVPDEIDWLHFDVMGWNLQSRPGHPQGGELFVIRALFDYINQRFNH